MTVCGFQFRARRGAPSSQRACRLGWNSPGEAAFQDLVNGAAQCIEPSRRKIDLGAEFGIGIVLSYALEEVEARCAVTYRCDSIPISECRYHFMLLYTERAGGRASTSNPD